MLPEATQAVWAAVSAQVSENRAGEAGIAEFCRHSDTLLLSSMMHCSNPIRA
jgi:hypothetical protein